MTAKGFYGFVGVLSGVSVVLVLQVVGENLVLAKEYAKAALKVSPQWPPVHPHTC